MHVYVLWFFTCLQYSLLQSFSQDYRKVRIPEGIINYNVLTIFKAKVYDKELQQIMEPELLITWVFAVSVSLKIWSLLFCCSGSLLFGV